MRRLCLLYFLMVALIVNVTIAFSQEKDSVCITRTGDRYHRSTCQYLRYTKITIAKETAIKNGYTPCMVCKPGAAHGGDAGDRAGDGQDTSGQCTALTKSGTRCKRSASGSGGRCWQHQ